MLRNYSKIIVRSLVKSKFYALLNVIGLSIGIAACLIVYIHISYEMSFDTFHSKGNRIYRITLGDISEPGSWVGMSAPIPPVIKDNFPEVEEYFRFARATYQPKALVQHENDYFYEDKFRLVDPSLFSIFEFKLLKGNPQNIFSEPTNLVLTESIAHKYFGNDDPMGKVVLLDGKHEFQVAGIMEDLPSNTHFDFQLVASFDNLERIFGQGSLDSWNQFNYYAYLLLKEGLDVSAFKSKLQNFTFERAEDTIENFENLSLQPLNDIHFQYNRGNLKPTYDRSYLYFFSILAVTILFVASINFINLTTAQSFGKIKEVGLRKTLGAARSDIMVRFLLETILQSLLSLVIAGMFIYYFSEYISQLLDSQVNPDLGRFDTWGIIFIIIMFVGILSGSYLAFFVSRFSPSSVLKGEFRFAGKGSFIKNTLLTFQFSITLSMIICSIIISKQLHFIQSKNLGLNKEQILVIPIYSKEVREKVNTIKTSLGSVAGVINASASSFIPGQANWHQTVWWEGQLEGQERSFYIFIADKDFVSTLQLEMVNGNIDELESLPEGEYTYLLNESAFEEIGIKDLVGKQISPFGESMRRPLAGIVKDFNFKSLHHNIDPALIAIGDKLSHAQLLIRYNSANTSALINEARSIYQSILPGIPFEYSFLDEGFDLLYKSEIKAGRIIRAVSALSIILALLGLYSLASFHIEERTKEIAIRKILGINNVALIIMLGKNFLKLFIMTILISWPLAWYVMDIWLNNFTYKTALNPTIFIISTIIVFIIVFVTISVKSLQASRRNPVVALRYE